MNTKPEEKNNDHNKMSEAERQFLLNGIDKNLKLYQEMNEKGDKKGCEELIKKMNECIKIPR